MLKKVMTSERQGNLQKNVMHVQMSQISCWFRLLSTMFSKL